jgi:ABC-type antimicrobial peptide transport system permease subunit
MFLCFFALSANMSANIYEQTKEIGVLRAMGFKKLRIKMLYFYEALVLITASSLLGLIIGMIVGYAFTLQQTLILNTNMAFFFPTE